jgi:hypothetical protein
MDHYLNCDYICLFAEALSDIDGLVIAQRGSTAEDFDGSEVNLVRDWIMKLLKQLRMSLSDLQYRLITEMMMLISF